MCTGRGPVPTRPDGSLLFSHPPSEESGSAFFSAHQSQIQIFMVSVFFIEGQSLFSARFVPNKRIIEICILEENRGRYVSWSLSLLSPLNVGEYDGLTVRRQNVIALRTVFCRLLPVFSPCFTCLSPVFIG